MPRSGYYADDEMIPLSGIQHFMFCERQWALIHLECQWQENFLTAEGALLHERVDDPSVRKSGLSGLSLFAGCVLPPEDWDCSASQMRWSCILLQQASAVLRNLSPAGSSR